MLFGKNLRELSLVSAHLVDHYARLEMVSLCKQLSKLDLSGNQWTIPLAQVVHDILSDLPELQTLLLNVAMNKTRYTIMGGAT